MAFHQATQAPRYESGARGRDVNLEKINLQSNCSTFCPESLKWLKLTDKATPMDNIRATFNEDGYILVKGLLPRDKVLSMRKTYFEFFSSIPLCKPGQEAQGIVSGGDLEDYPSIDQVGRAKTKSKFGELVQEAHTLPEYMALCNHPDLVDFIKELMDWRNTLLLKRTLLRPDVPGAEATGVHFDKLHLRGGDPNFLTAWIPLGDIEVGGGGLIYLEDSVPLGHAIEDKWLSEARSRGLSDEEIVSPHNAVMTDGPFCAKDPAEFAQKHSRKWLVSNFEAGDVMFHDAFMIHASSTNKDTMGKIRLSTDLRFCNPEKVIDERWMIGFVSGGAGKCSSE